MNTHSQTIPAHTHTHSFHLPRFNCLHYLALQVSLHVGDPRITDIYEEEKEETVTRLPPGPYVLNVTDEEIREGYRKQHNEWTDAQITTAVVTPISVALVLLFAGTFTFFWHRRLRRQRERRRRKEERRAKRRKKKRVLMKRQREKSFLGNPSSEEESSDAQDKKSEHLEIDNLASQGQTKEEKRQRRSSTDTTRTHDYDSKKPIRKDRQKGLFKKQIRKKKRKGFSEDKDVNEEKQPLLSNDN